MTDFNRILDSWPMLRDKGPNVWAAFASVLLDKGKGAEAFTLALAAFNKLAPPFHRLPLDTPDVRLLTQPIPLFSFGFAAAYSWPGLLANVEVTAQVSGTANTIYQWIRLTLDRSGEENSCYEVKPGNGRTSSWAFISWPLASALSLTAGQTVRIAGQRTDTRMMIWLAD